MNPDTVVIGEIGEGMSCGMIKTLEEYHRRGYEIIDLPDSKEDINTKEHGLNQCTNDWIMCKCGKLFADSKNGKKTAKEKFINHLQENGLTEDAFEYDKSIQKIGVK